MELWRRWWRSQKRHRGFRYWLWFRGLPFAGLVAILFVINGFVNGWTIAYEITVTITSPADARVSVVAWLLSIAGWLLIPCVAGAVAGYIVTDFIAGRRTRPVADLFAEDADG